jgi:hypothetical protein
MELKQVPDPDMSKALVPSGDELPDALARLFRGSPLQLQWAQNPSTHFNREIRKYTAELEHLWGEGGRLRLPSSWSVSFAALSINCIN